jgi:hypothetical protein
MGTRDQGFYRPRPPIPRPSRLWPRRLTLSACTLAITLTPALAETDTLAARWNGTFNAEARYLSFTNSLGGGGSQYYLPVAMQVTGNPTPDWKVEVLTRSGYIWSRQTSIAGITGEVNTPTDTTLGTTVTFLGIPGLQPFLSMNVNVPTGTTILTGTKALARLDVDAFENPVVFGEGWNFGPTLGVNIPILPNVILSLGAGYTARGPYNREKLTLLPEVTRLDPGDVLTFNASFGWQEGPLTLQAAAFYSIESMSTSDRTAFYDAGDRYFVWGSLSYAWTTALSSKVTASFNHIDPNKVLVNNLPPPLLEAFNSNSDVTRVTFDTSYNFGRFSLGPTASWLYRNHNSYSPIATQFTPAKERWAAGGVARLEVTDQASLTARVERVWQDQDVKPDIPVGNVAVGGTPAFTIEGWYVSVAGVLKL